MDYLKLFETEQEYNAYITDDPLLPNVSYVIDSETVHYNPKEEDYDTYLTFESLEDGTFWFTKPGLSYSVDGGQTWTALTGYTPVIHSGETIMFKGNLIPEDNHSIGNFYDEGHAFNIRGNIMSLLFGDNYKGQTDLTGYNHVFNGLFMTSTHVVDASNLILPATTLADYCYSGMFSLCTSLTAAPELPATTLAEGCYQGMFLLCTSLNYIKAMFTTTPSDSYTKQWVEGVAATGTFVKNANAQWDVTGVNGIPSGWTVETATE